MRFPAIKKRRYPRAVLPHGVQLLCWGDTFRGRVRILGEGGMFIDTIHPHSGGIEFEVTIEAEQPIVTRCMTRGVEPGWGMGVEFTVLSDDDRVRIRGIVSRYL